MEPVWWTGREVRVVADAEIPGLPRKKEMECCLPLGATNVGWGVTLALKG
jgi:hypothetical protein